MPVEVMQYHPNIQHLETKISYGTLGVINTLVKKSTTNLHHKRNCFLINGDTIIRNCYESGITDTVFAEKIRRDFEQLYFYCDHYLERSGNIITYFHPNMHVLIPEYARKKMTDQRAEINRWITKVVKEERFNINTLTKIKNFEKAVLYGMLISGTFSYRILMQNIRTMKFQEAPKIFLVSHCPIDYFLYESFPDMQIILSHNGKVLERKDLSQKVFKEPTIPFNRTMYKLFGDDHFVRALCRNRPKALALLKSVKLKLKTERECIRLATDVLKIEPKLLSWNL